MWVAGVDGCQNGWLVVLKELENGRIAVRRIRQFPEALTLEPEPDVLAIDMPIGLLERAVCGGRACEPEARVRLRWPRRNSVFSAPVRPALKATTYQEALELNRKSSENRRGVSPHCYGLFQKLREIDELMIPELQERIREVHPELCFYELNGQQPVVESKRSKRGREVRAGLLSGFGCERALSRAAELGFRGAKVHDVLDACAACWTAERILKGEAYRIPDPPPTDAQGLRMEMWI